MERLVWNDGPSSYVAALNMHSDALCVMFLMFEGYVFRIDFSLLMTVLLFLYISFLLSVAEKSLGFIHYHTIIHPHCINLCDAFACILYIYGLRSP